MATRIIWHPDVHLLYGEQLSFVFINVRRDANNLRTSICQTIESLQIRGYHCYDVFGSVDIVIRVWARQEKRDAMLSALGKIPNVIVRTVFTSSESPRYLWWLNCPAELPAAVLGAHSREQLESAQAEDSIEPIQNELQDEGLLRIKLPVVEDHSVRIKFFVYIAISGTSSRDAVLSKLLDSLHGASLIEDVSLYTAPGLHFLVKGTTVDYAAIGGFVLSIGEKLSLADFLTETHLVASTTRIESDKVDFRPIDPAIARLCGIWRFPEERVKANLSEEEQRSLAEVYVSIEKARLVKSDERGLLKSSFSAVIDRDEDRLIEKLSFLFSFERQLFGFVARLMAEIYGKNWIKTEFDRLKSATGIPNEFSPIKWTFADSIALLGKVESETGKVRAYFNDHDWQKSLTDARELRNDLAHGRLVSPLSDWPALLWRLAKILPLYYHVSPRPRID